MPNEYRDDKGHFTKKENDGQPCDHTGFSHRAVFTKKLKEFAPRAKEEASKRFLEGGSGKWEMSPEEKENARKNIGGELTQENILRWENEQAKAQRIIERKVPATSTIETPERKAMRKLWVEDEFKKQENRKDKNGIYVPIQYGKVALISLGNAGSGKSSAGGKFFLNEYGAYEVDPDIFKKYTPEFQKDPNYVGVVHKESSKVAEDMFNQAIEKGGNIFYPTTGRNLEKLEKKIKQLKDNGYDVYLDYVDLDIEENYVRTITRALAEGRYTTSNVIRDSYGVNRDNFDLLKDNPSISGWTLWDNNKGPRIDDFGGKKQLKRKVGK